MKPLKPPRLPALDPHFARLALWWSERSRREQRLLAILGAVAALVLIMQLVVRPVLAARATALADIRTYETLATRLRAAGPNLGNQGRRLTGDVPTVVNASIGQFGLAVQKMEQEDGATRLVIADASYESLMRWLAELDRASSLRLISLRLDRRPAPGFVTAELLLSQ
ncbi:general secretion pathway protein GspM [Sphingomonas oleivorans]|uniref:General secretion pathway protein GspM n=1 Tax=Sphingomonas oleivorans TaxID=1735121 RepID=A0A2T5FVQ0_9SPHN|nr:type II secretion system protein M [Sphingomonas oleivorans]PTQ09853.1 general secretion pathway protein GspM [Sphingomonas oleivorans]